MISLKIIERFGGADKTYCADGYKIILVACVGVVLFDDISDKAQIMDYQFIPCGIVPLGDFTDTFRLVLGGELSRELISSLKVQSENQKMLKREFYKQADHSKSSQNDSTKYNTCGKPRFAANKETFKGRFYP